MKFSFLLSRHYLNSCLALSALLALGGLGNAQDCWTEGVISTSADRANSVFAADVDGDGDLDALSASSFDDKIAWYENLAGDGSSWSTHVISTSADGAWSVFAADVDGDGDLDALSASTNDDKVAWYENLGDDADVAAAVYRNAVSNPASYVATPPILGGTFTGTVDLAGTTGHFIAALFGYATPLTLTLNGGQVLLVNVADPIGELLGQPLQFGPVAVFDIPVPNNVALCGFSLSTQALHVGGVVPFALSNAWDLVVGDK